MVKEYKDWLFVRLATVSPNYEYKIFGTDLVIYWNGFLQEAIPLPSGSWQIIGKGDGLGEEFWEPILEPLDLSDSEDAAFMYENYIDGNFNLTYWKDARDSLLRSLDMEPGTTLVLKKQN